MNVIFNARIVVPGLLVHGFMHDQTAVYVEHTLAHVNMLLQKGLHLIGRLEKEDIRGIGDENLHGERNCEEYEINCVFT